MDVYKYGTRSAVALFALNKLTKKKKQHRSVTESIVNAYSEEYKNEKLEQLKKKKRKAKCTELIVQTIEWFVVF